MDSTHKLKTVDELQMQEDPLQGPNDPYMAALGYDDLRDKVHNWAMDVISIGKYPKPQVLAGRITDVSGIVQAEVERIKQNKANQTCTNQDYQNVVDVVRKQNFTFASQTKHTKKTTPQAI